MAQQRDVQIFFKVDGLEQYITSLEQLDEVLRQVKGATEQTEEATNKLQESTEKFDDLETKLQTMEGATKALAGGLEFLTGAVGLLGLEDNPFFAELEQNTLQILALARGAIDLSEGVSLLAKNQKLATAAQAAFNAVANANPYVLLASAVIALGGALLLLANQTEDTTEETKKLVQSLKDEQKQVEDNVDWEKRLADARGQLTDDRLLDYNRQLVQGLIESNDKISDQIYLLNQRRSDLSDEEITELANLQSQLNANTQKINDLNQENILIDERRRTKKKEEDQEKQTERDREARRKREEDFQKQQALLAELRLNKIEDDRDKELEILRRSYEDQRKIAKDNAELLLLIEEDFRKRLKDINDRFKIEPIKPLKIEDFVVKEQVEQTTELLKRLRAEVESTKQLITSSNSSIEDQSEDVADAWAVSYAKAFDSIVEEPGKAAELLKRDISAALTFANNLNEIFTKDNEKRAEKNFKIQKALSLSTAIINTAEAITTALTDRTQASTILRILQTAAVAAAGAAQIATIARQQYKGGNTQPPPTPSGALGVPQINYNFAQTSGSVQTPGGVQSEPVRAYVLVSDVNNAQQANNQIERYSRL